MKKIKGKYNVRMACISLNTPSARIMKDSQSFNSIQWKQKKSMAKKKEDITRAFPITVAWFVDEMGQTEFFITVCFSVNYPELHCCEHYDI